MDKLSLIDVVQIMSACTLLDKQQSTMKIFTKSM